MTAGGHNQTALEPTITQRRRQTRQSVYQLIFDAGGTVSKQEIAKTLGLSLPTVHQNIEELLEADLIRAGEAKKSTGGRPPIGYEINADVRYSMSVAISSNHVRLWLGNLRQEEQSYRSIPVPNVTAQTISGERLRHEILAFLSAQKVPLEKLLGISVIIPGIFDEKKDQIVLSPTLNMKNFSVKELMDSVGIPVKVLNDSSSAGIEVLLERRKRGASENFVTLSLENGVGGAIFTDGRQFEGAHGRSAEFGHIRIVPDGRKCNCGQKGCLEAYCSAFRLTKDLGLTMETFFAGLGQEKGTGQLTTVFQEWLHYLSLGIINLRMAFDCDIVLCGFMTEYLQPYLEELRQEVEAQDPFGAQADYLQLAASSKAALQGAAWVFTDEFVRGI